MGPLTSAAQTAAQSAQSLPSWWPMVAALLGSSVLGGLITVMIGGLRASAEARREGYARAVRALIARVEFPYRIRRRTSDDLAALSALADRGHTVQEELAACRTWVNAEHRAMGVIYDTVLAAVDHDVAPAAQDAWSRPPLTAPADMNLGGWGPGDQWPKIERLQRAINFRFGWRRITPGWLITVRTRPR